MVAGDRCTRLYEAVSSGMSACAGFFAGLKTRFPRFRTPSSFFAVSACFIRGAPGEEKS